MLEFTRVTTGNIDDAVGRYLLEVYDHPMHETEVFYVCEAVGEGEMAALFVLGVAHEGATIYDYMVSDYLSIGNHAPNRGYYYVTGGGGVSVADFLAYRRESGGDAASEIGKWKYHGGVAHRGSAIVVGGTYVKE